jgi:hypothetical protein
MVFQDGTIAIGTPDLQIDTTLSTAGLTEFVFAAQLSLTKTITKNQNKQTQYSPNLCLLTVAPSTGNALSRG